MRYLILLMALCSCKNFQTNEKKGEIKHSEKRGDLLTSNICEGDYCLKVESVYGEDIFNDERILFNYDVEKQNILFFEKNKVIKKISYPVSFLDVKIDKNKTKRVQENVIYELSIIKGNKDWFYKISGLGIQHSQSEFYGVYTKKGELLWYNYLTERNFKGDPHKIYGNLDKIFKENGFDDESFNKDINSVEIKIPQTNASKNKH